MKKALIRPGYTRIFQVEPAGSEFPVCAPLEWRDCPDGVAAETHDFDGANFVAKPPPPPEPSEAERELACQGYFNGGGQVDLRKVIKAKMISDLAFRLGKLPGALTGAELLAERNRIAAIYKAL